MPNNEEKNKPLSLWGVGPQYVVYSILSSGLGVYFSYRFQDIFIIDTGEVFFQIVALTIFALGFILWISAATIIDKYILKGHLLTKGVYAIVRNPIYSGILLMLFGAFVFSQSWLLIASIIPNTILLRYLLKSEEQALTDNFGQEYINYKKKVNSLFPRLKR